MRGFQAPNGGLVLVSTPSRRQRVLRRRWLALSVILGVAFAGGIIGQMSASRGDPAQPTPPGPWSYMPQ